MVNIKEVLRFIEIRHECWVIACGKRHSNPFPNKFSFFIYRLWNGKAKTEKDLFDYKNAMAEAYRDLIVEFYKEFKEELSKESEQ